MINVNKRGIALYLVLVILIVVIILSKIVLDLISSQYGVTYHQVGRIQAIYAAQAGLRLAQTNLYANHTDWVTGTTNSITRVICRQNSTVFPCTAANLAAPNLTEPDFPRSVKYVLITIGPYTSGKRQINATVNYTAQ